MQIELHSDFGKNYFVQSSSLSFEQEGEADNLVIRTSSSKPELEHHGRFDTRVTQHIFPSWLWTVDYVRLGKSRQTSLFSGPIFSPSLPYLQLTLFGVRYCLAGSTEESELCFTDIEPPPLSLPSLQPLGNPSVLLENRPTHLLSIFCCSWYQETRAQLLVHTVTEADIMWCSKHF